MELKYSNVTIDRSEEDDKLKLDELNPSAIEVFDYRAAIELEIEEQRKKNGNDKTIVQIRKDIEGRYKDQIEAMQKI